MCILSKDIVASNTVIFLSKESNGRRSVIYCNTLSNESISNEGIMLLPFYVKRGGSIHFADVSKHFMVNMVKSRYGDAIDFLHCYGDEADGCSLSSRVNFQVGQFFVNLFVATPENLVIVEKTYGDPENPLFDHLNDNSIFPNPVPEEMEWVFVLASFSLANGEKLNYNLFVNYEVSYRNDVDFVPTLHEHNSQDVKQYDVAVLLTDIFPRRVNIAALSKAFVKEEGIKVKKHVNEDGLLHYYGTTSVTPSASEKRMRHEVFYGNENGSDLVTGTKVNPLIVYQDIRDIKKVPYELAPITSDWVYDNGKFSQHDVASTEKWREITATIKPNFKLYMRGTQNNAILCV